MYTEVVEWVPRAADELTDRKRLVRTTDDADLGLDSIAMTAGVLASPVLAIWAPAPMPGRLFASLALGIFFALGYGLSRHGLYLTRSGVVVWRFVWPRPPIAWADIGEFRLIDKNVDFG